MKNNLLVVDWDYFFPTNERPDDENLRPERGNWSLWDWGHKETEFHINDVWAIRGAMFKRAGIDLPQTSSKELSFWDRFNFKPNSSTLYFADSNMFAGTAKFLGYKHVYLFDAHHDCSYRLKKAEEFFDGESFSCEDWMLNHYFSGSKLHVRYPAWKTYAMDEPILGELGVDRQIDDGKDLSPIFDRVFVCRSGAWTPPWIDHKFMTFLRACPISRVVNMDNLKIRNLDEEQFQGFFDAFGRTI